MNWNLGWAPYVPLAQRKREGTKKAKELLRKGEVLSPINISGRQIASTFWGKGWCDYLEEFSDFASRLPRGRTYARNGSIAHLRIESGNITAMVCGTELYRIEIAIEKLTTGQWKRLCANCAASIHSVIDLMRGKLGDDVIEQLTDPDHGMFPRSREIRLSCSCPDGAYLCKHLAAVLYGVGHQLDSSPELLFLLRGVDQADLISETLAGERTGQSLGIDEQSTLDTDDLGAIFGINFAGEASIEATAPKRAAGRRNKTAQKRATIKLPRKKGEAKLSKKGTAPKKGKLVKNKSVSRTAAKRKAKKQTAKKQTAKKQDRKRASPANK